MHLIFAKDKMSETAIHLCGKANLGWMVSIEKAERIDLTGL